jgi:hypothetical protein
MAAPKIEQLFAELDGLIKENEQESYEKALAVCDKSTPTTACLSAFLFFFLLVLSILQFSSFFFLNYYQTPPSGVAPHRELCDRLAYYIMNKARGLITIQHYLCNNFLRFHFSTLLCA